MVRFTFALKTKTKKSNDNEFENIPLARKVDKPNSAKALIKTEGFSSTGIHSLTEKLAQANCSLEDAAQEVEYLEKQKEKLLLRLHEAHFDVEQARQIRDDIMEELQQRVQSANGAAHVYKHRPTETATA